MLNISQLGNMEQAMNSLSLEQVCLFYSSIGVAPPLLTVKIHKVSYYFVVEENMRQQAQHRNDAKAFELAEKFELKSCISLEELYT